MVIKSDTVISLQEASKLLGDEAIVMTDAEILKLIEDFDVIAQYTIKLVQEFKITNSLTD